MEVTRKKGPKLRVTDQSPGGWTKKKATRLYYQCLPLLFNWRREHGTFKVIFGTETVTRCGKNKNLSKNQLTE